MRLRQKPTRCRAAQPSGGRRCERHRLPRRRCLVLLRALSVFPFGYDSRCHCIFALHRGNARMEDVDLATAPDIAGIDFSADLRKIDSRRPMQHVTAFSRPETVPPVSATMPKRKLWILNSWRDLILYVGTPLLIIPLFAVAQARWSAQEIYIFVAAFGALGHHLPGMIRAYGDRALFERFRWRFIIAPVFLLAVCVGFYLWDIKTNPVVMIVFL